MPRIRLKRKHSRQINSYMNQEQMKHMNLRKYMSWLHGWQLTTGNSGYNKLSLQQRKNVVSFNQFSK
jgi:hypothetical protein